MNLYYYGARYYDPMTGFTQIDPLRNKYPGWGPYVYALDNPMVFVDRNGRAAEEPRREQHSQNQDLGVERVSRLASMAEKVNTNVVQPAVDRAYSGASAISNYAGNLAMSTGITGGSLAIFPGSQPEGLALMAVSTGADLVKAGADVAKQVLRPESGGWEKIGVEILLSLGTKGAKTLESVQNIGKETGKQLEGMIEILKQIADATVDAIVPDQNTDNSNQDRENR